MTRIIIASCLLTILAHPALAFDPQPEPPSQQNQMNSAQQKSKAKAKPTYTDEGRTLADYNIQKE